MVGNISERKSGGGIFNDGKLTLSQRNISSNRVTDCESSGSPQGYYGGGLLNSGIANIKASSFINNSSCFGGAIASRRGSIDEFGATTTSVLASTISNNRASFDESAIFSSFSEVEIIGSTIIDNGRNTVQESQLIKDDVTAISIRSGDARYDDSIMGEKFLGQGIFASSCSGCHSNRRIKANRKRYFSYRCKMASADDTWRGKLVRFCSST